MALEPYLFHIHPHTSESALVPAIGGFRTAKKRARLEPLEVSSLIRKQRKIGESSNVVARTVTSRRDIESGIVVATCRLHRSALQHAFKGVRSVALAWDPGSYSGYSWQIGVLANSGCSDEDVIATDLTPKVGIRCMNRMWGRCFLMVFGVWGVWVGSGPRG